MTHTYTPAELRKMVADATPIPWSVPGQPDKVCAEGYTANGWAKVIVTVQDKSWMPPVECFANAHLMAQSPTIALALADALEEVARLREGILSGIGPDLGAETEEPSLQNIIFRHYLRWMNDNAALAITDRYLAALTRKGDAE